MATTWTGGKLNPPQLASQSQRQKRSIALKPTYSRRWKSPALWPPLSPLRSQRRIAAVMNHLLHHRAPSPLAASSITGPGTKPSASTNITIATSTTAMPADGNGCHGRTGSRKYMATTMRK